MILWCKRNLYNTIFDLREKSLYVKVLIIQIRYQKSIMLVRTDKLFNSFYFGRISYESNDEIFGQFDRIDKNENTNKLQKKILFFFFFPYRALQKQIIKNYKLKHRKIFDIKFTTTDIE